MDFATIGSLILICPLIGFLINVFFGSKLPEKLSAGIATLAVFGSFIFSVIAFFKISEGVGVPADVDLFTWMAAGRIDISIGFLFDQLSGVMLLIITGIGTLIHIYSIGYMEGEVRYQRFFTYLNLFIFSMLILVLGKNIPMMFIGWEGVGLCSYLLIGFYFEKDFAADASKKAFVVNRIGDFCFILGMFLLFWSLAKKGVFTLDFVELNANAHILRDTSIWGDYGLTTVICLLFFGGATAKSAQIPLYVWLPDAMAGPTPVSALIHAATMVTAGIYFIARNNVLFSISPDAQTIIATIAALTAFFAATIGLVQNDIKKILAYSTVSQLGYMFIGVGIGAFSSGVFHLMTHAFFKALLFLGAGSVIHIVHHSLHHSHEDDKDAQDIRNMGGLGKKLPKYGTYGTFLVAWLAICGIPPFSGFFSKDEILAKAWAWGDGFNFVWLLGFLGAILTAFYMTRLVYLTFFGETRMSKKAYDSIHESPTTMTFPLMVLGLFAFGIGLVGIPHAFGGHNWFGETWLAPVFSPETIHLKGFHLDLTTDYILIAASIGAALFGIFLAKSWYTNVDPADPDKKLKSVISTPVYNLLSNKYYIDEIYDAVVVRPIHFVSKEVLAVADMQILDGWIVNGTGKIFVYLGSAVKHLQTGYVPHYALSLVVGAIFVVGYFIF